MIFGLDSSLHMVEIPKIVRQLAVTLTVSESFKTSLEQNITLIIYVEETFH